MWKPDNGWQISFSPGQSGQYSQCECDGQCNGPNCTLGSILIYIKKISQTYKWPGRRTRLHFTWDDMNIGYWAASTGVGDVLVSGSNQGETCHLTASLTHPLKNPLLLTFILILYFILSGVVYTCMWNQMCNIINTWTPVLSSLSCPLFTTHQHPISFNHEGELWQKSAFTKIPSTHSAKKWPSQYPWLLTPLLCLVLGLMS